MHFNKTLAVAAGAAAALAFASAVAAQTPPPAPRPAAPLAVAPAAPPVKHGPAIPGVCTYNGDQAVQDSEVGKYVAGRMKQNIAEVNA